MRTSDPGGWLLPGLGDYAVGAPASCLPLVPLDLALAWYIKPLAAVRGAGLQTNQQQSLPGVDLICLGACADDHLGRHRAPRCGNRR
jgi:hypothetical protein